MLAFLIQSFSLQFSSPALFLTSRKDTCWIKLKASDGWEQPFAKGKQRLSIQEQAERFSFSKQLTWDLLLFGKEDAFPTVQHLSEAAAKELSRCRSRQRGTILCQASQVNEVVCFSAGKMGREFVTVTEHVTERWFCFRCLS